MKKRIDTGSSDKNNQSDRRRFPLAASTAAVAAAAVFIAGCTPKGNNRDESSVPLERVIERVVNQVEDVEFPVNRADFVSDQEYAQSQERGEAFANLLHKLHAGILEARDNGRIIPFESEEGRQEMVSEFFQDTQNGRQNLILYDETRTSELEISGPINEDSEPMYPDDTLPQGIYYLVYETSEGDISLNVKIEADGRITLTSIVFVDPDGAETSVGGGGPYESATEIDNKAFGLLNRLRRQVEITNDENSNANSTAIPNSLHELG